MNTLTLLFATGCLVAAAGTAVLAQETGAGAPAGGPAGSAGTVEGELTVGKEKVPLRHAYALEVEDLEGAWLPEKPVKRVVLLLTDAPMAPEMVEKWAQLASLARAGKLHAVSIQIDPVTKQMFAGTIYFGGGKDEPPNLSITAQNSPTYKLTDLKLGGGQISGTAAMPNAEKWPSFNDAAPPRTFQYRVKFQAPLRAQPKVTQTLVGKPAQDSAPVAGMLAFEDACRKGDLAAAQKLALPAVSADWPELEKQSGGRAAFLKLLRESLPDRKSRLAGIKKVIVRGDRATILLNEAGGGGYQPMIRQGGVWMVDAS